MWATLVALAAWVGTATPAHAQRGGGHGGGHSGGHVSGGHAGNFHSGGGYYGGGAYHGGNYNHGGYYNRGYGSAFLGLGLYSYPSYGYGGYYGGYGYPSTVYNENYYVAPEAAQSLYYTPAPTATPTTTTLPATDNRARIMVRLPADAALWVDGEPTRQTGSEREFTTPSLTPGDTFTYTLTARWTQGNDPVEKTIKVDVRANQTSQADFMR